MRWLLNRTVLLTVVVLLLLGGGAWWWLRDSTPADQFRTTDVKRGDVESTISATGTVEPEEVVDVGAQVAGLIDYFGKDLDKPGKFVDYGSRVQEGMVLAHIDDSLYAADAESANAAIAQAVANVTRAQADLGQMKAKLVEAQRDWDRAQKIGPSDALSENDYDMYQANFETAKANVAVDEAAVLQAQSAVTEAQAEAKKTTKNLAYCTIVSPVNGVVIDRRVNIGQTVVSSLSAPSLFLIAKDLKRMQVWASVNEADVGSIYAGQPVTFTVDAFPGRTFVGKVGKVRYNATMTQNVVTYTVEITTDNSDNKLIPYLTASVEFLIAKRHNVLLVPSAALRWTPQASQVSADVRDQTARQEAGAQRRLTHADGSPADTDLADQTAVPTTQKSADAVATKPDGDFNGDDSSDAPHHEQGIVWVKDGKFVRPIRVIVGVSDGANTQVSARDPGDITEGTPIIVGDTIADSGVSGGGDPFLPQFGRGSGDRRNHRSSGN
jgi:HlyD family secretion protein